MRRAADVAVVEADDAKARVDELAAEVHVPRDHLRAEAHDQQQRRVRRVAERVVAEADPSADISELFVHETDPTGATAPPRHRTEGER
jgi:hypothetical protein